MVPDEVLWSPSARWREAARDPDAVFDLAVRVSPASQFEPVWRGFVGDRARVTAGTPAPDPGDHEVVVGGAVAVRAGAGRTGEGRPTAAPAGAEGDLHLLFTSGGEDAFDSLESLLELLADSVAAHRLPAELTCEELPPRIERD